MIVLKKKTDRPWTDLRRAAVSAARDEFAPLESFVSLCDKALRDRIIRSVSIPRLLLDADSHNYSSSGGFTGKQ